MLRPLASVWSSRDGVPPRCGFVQACGLENSLGHNAGVDSARAVQAQSDELICFGVDEVGPVRELALAPRPRTSARGLGSLAARWVEGVAAPLRSSSCNTVRTARRTPR